MSVLSHGGLVERFFYFFLGLKIAPIDRERERFFFSFFFLEMKKKKKKERKNIEEERRRRGKKRVERGRKERKKERDCSVVYGKIVGPCMGEENNKKKGEKILF